MKFPTTFAMALFVLLLLSPATTVLAKKKKKERKVAPEPASPPNLSLLPKSQAAPTPSPVLEPPNPALLPKIQAAPTPTPALPPSPVPPPNVPLLEGFNVFVNSCEGVNCDLVCMEYGTDPGGPCKTYQGFYYCHCL